MQKKILIIIIIVASVLMIASVVLSQTGILDAGEAQAAGDGSIEVINNVEELEDECFYIWKNCKGKKIDAKDNEFILCPEERSNIDYEDKDDGGANYTVWVDSSKDGLIPTLTSSDMLLYKSKKGIPETFDFLRLYENGYSIGVTSLAPDDGHYYISGYDGDIDEYVNIKSDAGELDGLNVERLYFDKVGGVSVDENNISASGIITGLKKNKQYVCELYTGTYYQDYMLTSNQHTFTEFEDFECKGYSFLHSSCISVEIPEWLCTGYYYLNGEALFRYVDDNDVAIYNGKPYDKNIDWNVPLIQYNEMGQVIFDPSQPVDEESIAIEVEGEPEGDEQVPEVAGGNTATWTYNIVSDEAFCAVVNVTALENSEPAYLFVTPPDGEEVSYEEKDNQIVVNIAKPQEGEYTFRIENITGRKFSVLYSTGETYYGEGE
ncbi:hypothetical protein SAMN04487829_1992 [Pseudobutyrivibrio sp. NOR37]|uniref:Uncharacterized protein n=1 Tax=Pseudobutyrivibrio xylanivorans TaxID=185007 RepID=A0A6M0LIN7_PSEXY|nr:MULTISPECIES: hypothetical protein [Pseudobutyrivibrio]NEX02365.1 hypothetical protein [Pseudobutyrivibrio xylanivorans]SFR78544.1 hypothetical protein SAMN04487829_1992 [Pseudobutyrivibrio sp. NOR37]